MKNMILSGNLGEYLRRHLTIIVVVVVVGYIVLGFPPGFPSVTDIEIMTDKTLYETGDRLIVTLYLRNGYPFPIRMPVYNIAEVYMEYEGEPVGGGYRVHLNWGEITSIYLGPMQEQRILEPHIYQFSEAGEYCVVVKLYGSDTIIASARRFITVKNPST